MCNIQLATVLKNKVEGGGSQERNGRVTQECCEQNAHHLPGSEHKKYRAGLDLGSPPQGPTRCLVGSPQQNRTAER